jgi:hypothetical protein
MRVIFIVGPMGKRIGQRRDTAKPLSVYRSASATSSP